MNNRTVQSVVPTLVGLFLVLGGSYRALYACESDGLVLKTTTPVDLGTVAAGFTFSKDIRVCRADKDPDTCSYTAAQTSGASWDVTVEPSSFVLDPNGCASVTVSGKTPKDPTYSASILIQNDDGTQTSELFRVIGETLPTCESDFLSVTPDYINLGLNNTNTPFSKSFTVQRIDQGATVCHYKVSQFIPVSWVTSVAPTDLSLVAGDSATVTVSGKTPSLSSYTASIEIKNVDTSVSDFVDISGTGTLADGIFDYVTAHGPATAAPGATVSYSAGFSSSEARVITWDWTFSVYHQGGAFVAQHVVQKPFPPNKGSTFTVAIPLSLPAGPTSFFWQRDAHLDVAGAVTVVATDEDGFSHTSVVYVGLDYPPDKPGLSVRSSTDNSVTLSFIADGASSYKVYYDKDAGDPFTGVDAFEGPSPVSVTEPSITLHFPGPGASRYFAVKAFGHGASDYSNEVRVILPPLLPVTPTLSSIGLALLSGLLLFFGVVILRRRRQDA